MRSLRACFRSRPVASYLEGRVVKPFNGRRASREMQPGRNDPCPCGSGKKYKKCCADSVRPSVVSAAARAATTKRAAFELSERMFRFARIRLGPDWLERALTAYRGGPDEPLEENEMPLAMHWSIDTFPVPDLNVTLARLFREEHDSRLPPDLRAVLEAHFTAWVSIWEVRGVEREVGMALTDLLTGEKRFVHDVSSSRTLNARDALLGSVLESDGVCFFGGVHPQPLKPRDADFVVREARRLCRVRTRPVKPERLREPGIQLALIYYWRASAVRAKARPVPTFTNTDGDPLVFTTDHFDVLAPDRLTVVSRLVTLPGAQEPETGEGVGGETVITITKPGNARIKSWDNTVIGRLVLKGKRLRAESNSVRRADALRTLMMSHLGDLVQHHLRDEVSDKELLRRALEASGGSAVEKPREQSPELDAIEREFKETHMLAWLDDEIPALGGLTPREAAKSRRSMKSLELLLREIENHEARLPESQRFDVGRLRAELGALP